ncbi:MAG: hypothetical protein HKP14_02000 [Bacteroidia bacterium]|nr:hypothetical protein [Bacteroidia bacterium]
MIQSFAQNSLDSFSHAMLDSASLKQKQVEVFQKILKKRNSFKLKQHLDTTHRHVFITEYYNTLNNNYSVYEHYFNATDTLAKNVYLAGKEADVEEYYNPLFGIEIEKIYPSQTLNFKSEHYKNFGLVQRAEYDSIVLAYSTCVSRPDMNQAKKDKSNAKKRIQSTYKICTYIDVNADAIYISFQTPVKNPQLRIINYNPVWDW